MWSVNDVVARHVNAFGRGVGTKMYLNLHDTRIFNLNSIRIIAIIDYIRTFFTRLNAR